MHPFNPISALSCSVCTAGTSPGKLDLLGQDRTPGEAAACVQHHVCHRVILLRGAERFVEQNQDLDYRQGSSVDAAGGAAPQGSEDQPPTLAGKAGPVENRDN